MQAGIFCRDTGGEIAIATDAALGFSTNYAYKHPFQNTTVLTFGLCFQLSIETLNHNLFLWKLCCQMKSFKGVLLFSLVQEIKFQHFLSFTALFCKLDFSVTLGNCNCGAAFFQRIYFSGLYSVQPSYPSQGLAEMHVLNHSPAFQGHGQPRRQSPKVTVLM